MDKEEARNILAEHLARYRTRSYSELVRMVSVKHVDTFEVTGASGTTYQLEFQFFWDGRPEGKIRVMGSIDDGGWRAFLPMTDDFILGPEEPLYSIKVSQTVDPLQFFALGGKSLDLSSDGMAGDDGCR